MGGRPRPPPARGDAPRRGRDRSGADLMDHLLDDRTLAEQLATDVRAGLTATPKTLPPKYFYDAHGSELFDAITRLPEYYPTRTERAILEKVAPSIAEATGAETL